MSATATANDAATDTEAVAKPRLPWRRKLLYALLVLITLGMLAAGGALYVLKKNTAGDDAADDGEDATSLSQPARPSTPPVFLPLDNMVVNLADAGGTRFVQIGISLQIQDAKTGEAMKAYMPSIRSSVLLLISQRTSDEMLKLQGKERLARDIVAEISRIMGYRAPGTAANAPANPVQAVLFSSFIVQ